MSLSSFHIEEYIPKSWICWREGYTRKILIDDIFAGISVGVIALPLALAFAIGSGVAPEQGLFTAIIAGFLISLLGGSRVQIGGPTGAFVVIVFDVIQRHGYEGLALATLIAGMLMILMGLFRFGVLLKFIPFPVTTGFTTGIALVIFTSQLKDFFGLKIDELPAQFLQKCTLYCLNAYTWNSWATLIAISVLCALFLLRRFFPKMPGAIIAIIGATVASSFFELPIETIESKFGGIPRLLPTPSLPTTSYALIKEVFPDAITIALLGAIESLLSAVVADGMTGHRHRSNGELVAQGIANIGSVFFRGIPATGAIARTTANIKMGAKTPLSGMVHAFTLLLLMLLLAPLAAKIPLCALSAVLVFVAWNMAELPHFMEILRGPKDEAGVLLATFLLTVIIDLAVAVQVGVILAAMLFIKKMADATSLAACRYVLAHNGEDAAKEGNLARNGGDDDLIGRKDIPDEVMVFELDGPFFYSVTDILEESLIKLQKQPKVYILRMAKVPIVDTTGLKAIKDFFHSCRKKKILFLISEVPLPLLALFQESSVAKTIGHQHLFSSLDDALSYAEKEMASSCSSD